MLSSPVLDYPLDGNSFSFFEPRLFSFLRLLMIKILSFTLTLPNSRTA